MLFSNSLLDKPTLDLENDTDLQLSSQIEIKNQLKNRFLPRQRKTRH